MGRETLNDRVKKALEKCRMKRMTKEARAKYEIADAKQCPLCAAVITGNRCERCNVELV